VAATSSEFISRPGSPGSTDVWLEIPSKGRDLGRCQFVNHFRELAAVVSRVTPRA